MKVFCKFTIFFHLFNVNTTTPLLNIFLDGLYGFKSYAYFERYFNAIQLIQQINGTPLSLFLIKLSFHFIMLKYLLFYFANLSETIRVVFLDFYHVAKVSIEFNMIGFSLYICAWLQLNQVYFHSTNSDYTRLLYRIIILKDSNLFLQSTIKGIDVCALIYKFTIYFSNTLVYCCIVSGTVS